MEIEIPDVALGQPAAEEMLAVWLVAGCCFAVSMVITWFAVRRCRQGLPVVERRPHDAVPWSGADVAAAVLAFLGLQVLAAEMLPAGASLHARLAAGSFAMLAATAVSAGHLWARSKDRGVLGFGLGRLGDDLRLAAAGLGLMLAPLLGLAAMLDRVVPYRHAIVDFLAAHRDGVSIGLVVFAAVVAAPVAEEFLFRRVLQGWLEAWFEPIEPTWGGRAAIVLSSLAFAAAHVGQGLAWVPLFFFGLVVGYLSRQTGSIVPAIMLHGLFNAVSVGLVLLQTAAPDAGGGGKASPV
jgi:membrane protease YdiL (CAAX protease family)